MNFLFIQVRKSTRIEPNCVKKMACAFVQSNLYVLNRQIFEIL